MHTAHCALRAGRDDNFGGEPAPPLRNLPFIVFKVYEAVVQYLFQANSNCHLRAISASHHAIIKKYSKAFAQEASNARAVTGGISNYDDDDDRQARRMASKRQEKQAPHNSRRRKDIPTSPENEGEEEIVGCTRMDEADIEAARMCNPNAENAQFFQYNSVSGQLAYLVCRVPRHASVVAGTLKACHALLTSKRASEQQVPIPKGGNLETWKEPAVKRRKSRRECCV